MAYNLSSLIQRKKSIWPLTKLYQTFNQFIIKSKKEFDKDVSDQLFEQCEPIQPEENYSLEQFIDVIIKAD